MNIQIFGKTKCFATKKAERFFKEHGVKYQYIDLRTKGMSRRELESVVQAVGGLEPLVDEKHRDYALWKYLLPDAQLEKLLEQPELLRTPICRNGRAAAVGEQPEIWKQWLKEG